MKLTILLLFLLFLLLIPFAFVKAEGSAVSLSATVVGAPTINDFDLSGLNPDAKPTNDIGAIKGTSTKAGDDSTAKIVALELGAVLIVALMLGLMKKKRRAFARLDQKLMGNSA